MQRVLLHHVSTGRTGRALARLLNCIATDDGHTEERPRYLIRWGTTCPARFIPSITTLNLKSALRAKMDRIDQLRLLEAAGIPIPMWSNTRSGWLGGTIVRSLATTANGAAPTRGRGIEVIRDITQVPEGRDLYMELIDKSAQYRVHVVGTRTRLQRLEPTIYAAEPTEQPDVWNDTAGRYRYITTPGDHRPDVRAIAVSAVAALNMDFGAVDIIIESRTGRIIVLEVNSAPGLVDEPDEINPTIAWWAKQLNAMTGGADLPLTLTGA